VTALSYLGPQTTPHRTGRTDGMARDNKFNLFDLVTYKDAEYWVTGLRACIGYDSLNWVYQLTKPAYHEAKATEHGWLGGRMDVDTVPEVKEHEILSGGDALKRKLDELVEAKTSLLKSIEDLTKRELELRQAVS
jgi:hypothetical protein